jgi:hypothetical protein
MPEKLPPWISCGQHYRLMPFARSAAVKITFSRVWLRITRTLRCVFGFGQAVGDHGVSGWCVNLGD